MKGAVWPACLERIGAAVGKYKYVFFVMLLGVFLLLLPDRDREEQVGTAVLEEEAPFQVEAVEQKLEEALSKVEGAGQVTVVLTVKGGSRRILAQDRTVTERDGDRDVTVSTVVVSRGSGTEDTITLQQISPEFQGALVVCSGGEDPAVRLNLVEAVSALTGLGADRISVCKGSDRSS